jgi:DNA-directed RNA polymerase subunit RPC12/RpoP
MGFKRLDSIDAYRRHGYNLRVVCEGCGKAVTLDSHAVGLRCRTATQRLISAIEDRLKCSQCGGKRVYCAPVERE